METVLQGREWRSSQEQALVSFREKGTSIILYLTTAHTKLDILDILTHLNIPTGLPRGR